MAMPSRDLTYQGQDERGALLRREGDYWTIAYDGQLLRLRDSRGLHYLEILLRHPGRAFHVSELLAIVSGENSTAVLDEDGVDRIERRRKAVTNRIRQTLARIRATHETLGLHLGNAVHTGTRCSYTPERPLTWEE
jgi:hypothetical protein